jgi:hypothetical protein
MGFFAENGDVRRVSAAPKLLRDTKCAQSRANDQYVLIAHIGH